MAKKILLIEDEEIMVDLLKKKLSNEGYEVLVAKDGEEGLKVLKQIESKPDLILLDIIMPKLGGFEVMEEMRKDIKLKDIPVMIISNSGQPVELEKAKNLGAKDWIIKTDFDVQEVILKVKRIFNQI